MADENKLELLDFLLGKGVTPSFSFPLDVCKFVAEGTMDWRSKTWASTDQDLRVSLSEYAPGRVLTINKEDYRVGGLYYMMAPDRINRARHVLGEGMESEALLYYNRCYTSGCDFVHKDVERELLDKDCPVCMHPNSIKTKRFLKPEGFAPIMVPWDIRRDQQVTSQQKRNTGRYYCMKPEPVVRTTNETRAIGRVELPAPLMSEDESETMEEIQLDDLDDFGGYSQRLQLFGSRQKDIGEVGIELILVNSGFKDRGYYICRDCGRAEIKDSIPIMGDHSRPYAINLPRGASAENKNDANDACGGKPLGNSDQGEGILLGARFRSDLVSFRFKIKKPLERGNKLIINHEFNGGLLAIKEALITEVQREMKYVNREIGGGIRKFAQLDENGEPEYFVDIFLYDQVSGGAGLVTELADYPEKLPEIFKLVESRLSGTKCTSGKPCSRACVGCLLDFRNKTEHSKLDRVNGRRILKWLKDGSAPVSDFSSEEEDGNESSSIERLVRSISTIAGSSLRVRSEKPDGVHTVVVIESENGDKSLRIRPVSSLARARSDPIIGKDYDYRREISSTADNQPGKGHMGFADMEAGFVPLVSRLKMDLNGEVDWS